jgi:glutaconyl-CoA decarboxylase
MNELIQEYDEKSRPKFCAQEGFVDEIVNMNAMRSYIKAFADSSYQNPQSICAFHQMLLPRVTRDFDTFKKP